LTDLAVNQKVAASTQNEALHAILFLYKEVLRLDFEQNQIIVRDGKGMESRISMLPGSIVEELKMHLQGVQLSHLQDLEKGLPCCIIWSF
jgi:ABC-type bacteriocin/lantibiotic exporter with double-glycine peptidase domain